MSALMNNLSTMMKLVSKRTLKSGFGGLTEKEDFMVRKKEQEKTDYLFLNQCMEVCNE